MENQCRKFNRLNMIVILMAFFGGISLGLLFAQKITMPLYWRDVRNLSYQMEHYPNSIIVISPQIAALTNFKPNSKRGDDAYPDKKSGYPGTGD